jgi:hypothetical protein
MRALLTVAAFLALATPASARPPLTQARADKEAASYAADQTQAAEWAEWADEADDEFPAPTSADLDPCDLVSSRRAECDGTFTYTDGNQCDFLIVVRTTRRDRLTSDLELTYCDGDE